MNEAVVLTSASSLADSVTVTLCPAREHEMAALSPARPAPTMVMLSGDFDSLCSAMIVGAKVLCLDSASSSIYLVVRSNGVGWSPLRAFSVHARSCRGHELKLTNAVVDHGSY
jgi:hypothetical protein